MSSRQRIFVDVTYTRTQQGSVGITRTVRRLLDALRSMGGEEPWLCEPAAFHSSGYRRAEATSIARSDDVRSRRLARMLSGVSTGPVRRAVSGLMPLPMLHFAWRVYYQWTFDHLSERESPIDFESGDWLVIGDQAWNYSSWTGAAKAREKGAKVVLILYDLIPLRQPQFCNPLFTRVFGDWLEYMLANADLVLCISKATEHDLREYCRASSLVLPFAGHFRLGSDPVVVGEERQDVRAVIKWCLSQQAPCFAAIGSFEPRKNYGFLLDVFEDLWAAGNDIRLLVIGRPNEESRALIDRFISHPEAGVRLTALFDATDVEIAYVYAHCCALVFPSLAEGFGLPLVEARAAGCPVIASNLPALAELADAGVTLVPPGSKALFKEEVLRAAALTPSAGIPPMATFSWNDSARQFVERIGLASAREP